MGKPKRRFADAVKRQAVDDYVSGRKSVAQVAAANAVSTGQVYKWKTQLEEKAKGAVIDEVESTGRSLRDAKRMDGSLATNALETAIKRRTPKRGVIHHSHRGVQLRFNCATRT